MTVAQLIDILKTLPQELRVVAADTEDWWEVRHAEITTEPEHFYVTEPKAQIVLISKFID